MSDIVKKIKELDLPSNEFIVIGSGVLDVLGIRKSRDIDIVASKKLFSSLFKNKEWKKKWFFIGCWERKGIHNSNGVEIYDGFKYKDYYYPFKEVFARSFIVEGIHFISLDDLIELKSALGRPKDIRDIKYIEEYKINKKQKTSFD